MANRISCGVVSLNEKDVTGQDIDSVMSDFSDVLNIPENAQALVNGREVSGSYIVQANDVIEFRQRAGTKG